MDWQHTHCSLQLPDETSDLQQHDVEVFLSTQSRTEDLPAGTVGHMKLRMHYECSALNTSLIVWVIICGMHMDAKPKLGLKCSSLMASII